MASVIEKTIEHNGNYFRVNSYGKWKGLFFGTRGPQDKIPRYFYSSIATEKVPEEVIKAARTEK